jgi:hypothetical protein
MPNSILIYLVADRLLNSHSTRWRVRFCHCYLKILPCRTKRRMDLYDSVCHFLSQFVFVIVASKSFPCPTRMPLLLRSNDDSARAVFRLNRTCLHCQCRTFATSNPSQLCEQSSSGHLSNTSQMRQSRMPNLRHRLSLGVIKFKLFNSTKPNIHPSCSSTFTTEPK